MALQDVLFTNRVMNASPLLQDDSKKAALIVLGAALLATAGVGKQFFNMDNLTAYATFGSGASLAIAGATERDATLCLLAVALMTATGVSMIQAFRDGRFYVKVDLAQLLRFGYDVLTKKP